MEYVAKLKKDKILAGIINDALPKLQVRSNIPLRLMAGIMSQQLSTKVAKVIYKRFLEVYGSVEPTPEQVVNTPNNVLRGIGLSNAKVTYIHNVASFCIENNISDSILSKMSDSDIIALLTQIKGVGKWTVEMLLMFTLAREDVFAVDDLGVQQAMITLYKINLEDKKALKEKMLKLSERWKPFRTYACLHLWRWKDNIDK